MNYNKIFNEISDRLVNTGYYPNLTGKQTREKSFLHRRLQNERIQRKKSQKSNETQNFRK